MRNRGKPRKEGEVFEEDMEEKISKKKCVVPSCNSLFYGKSEERGHLVPPAVFRGKLNPRRSAWLDAIKIDRDLEEPDWRVCRRHFLPDDYNVETDRLLPSAVPSQNLPGGTREAAETLDMSFEEAMTVNSDDNGLM